MTTLREAAQQALEALETLDRVMRRSPKTDAACHALRDALAEPVQEPVAWVHADNLQGLTLGLYGYVEIYSDESAGRLALYTAPPQRKPLTEGEIYAAIQGVDSLRAVEVARAIEQAHGIE